MAQLSLDDALKDQALGKRIVEAANAGFVQLMREVARSISLRRSEVTVDDLRAYAINNGLEPSSPNAWGVVFSGPSWEMIGRRRSALASNRGREVKVWRWRGTYTN